MRPLNRDPTSPRKLRPSDTSLGYDVHQSRTIPARAPPPPSTPASRTANVIEQFLASGPRSRREVHHHFTIRNCEEGTLEDALALLGAVEKPTMFLPARGLVMMVRLCGQRIEKTAYEAPVEAPRRQRRPHHLGTRKVF
jgi:hypothetical protein